MPSFTRSPRRPVIAGMLVATALAVSSLGGCSSDPKTAGSPTTTTTLSSTVAATGNATIPEPFTGTMDEFYDVPDPLPAGKPGEVIRLQELGTENGRVGLRIMYHSTDFTGADRAVTGTIYHPEGAAPEGGWPVVNVGHGTTGIISKCAPSRLGLVPSDNGVDGVSLMTDYIGLGPNGELHPYLSKTAEGNAVLDLLVAAHNVLGEQASPKWVMVGHSQGGHAALVSAEMAADRVPQYELLGTVAVAPGSQFEHTYGDVIQTRIITTMIMLGSRSEHPDFDPADYIAPDTLSKVEDIVLNNCLDNMVDPMVPLVAADDYFTVDTESDPVVRAFMKQNDAAVEVVDAPLLLIAGGKDIIVVPPRTEALRERLCDMGQQTEYTLYPEADHGVGAPATAEVDAWVQARFAGKPATDDCNELRAD